jgi:RES domain-containing protein
VIVPSFAHRAQSEDRNVVFWRWGAAPPHQVRGGRFPALAAR